MHVLASDKKGCWIGVQGTMWTYHGRFYDAGLDHGLHPLVPADVTPSSTLVRSQFDIDFSAISTNPLLIEVDLSGSCSQ